MAAGEIVMGRVVAGQPSFPCGCVPVKCCMFPWPDPIGEVGGPLYGTADLAGTLYILLPDESFVEVTLQPGSYIYVSADFSWSIAAEELIGQFWTIACGDTESPYFSEGNYWFSPCLIGGGYEYSDVGFGSLIVTDVFPMTFNIFNSEFESLASITRGLSDASLCCWDGAWEAALASLCYRNGADGYGFYLKGGPLTDWVKKTGNQDTPAGFYGDYEVA